MRILLRKINGVFGALIGSAGGHFHFGGSSVRATSELGFLSSMSLLVASWLPFIAIAALLIAFAMPMLLGAAVPAASIATAPSDTLLNVVGLAVMGTTVGVYETAELTGVVNSLIGLKNGLHATFIKMVKMSTSEIIAFDIDEKKRYLAPYVHPKSPGKATNARGFRTDTFKPAYIKQLTVIDPDRPLKRSMGEALMGELSPEARLDAVVTQELADHREEIDRRLEQQTVQALTTGTITMTGDDYPETVVNFGRNATLNVAANTLAGAALWSASTADPVKNFRNWSKKAVKLSGSILRNFVLDSDGYDAFRGLEKIDRQFNVLNIDMGKLNTNQPQDEGLILRGEIDGHLIWTYDAWFTNDAGDDIDAISGGRVIGVGNIDGVTHYGAIKDFKAKMQALPIFAKSWEEENPSGLSLLTQTAPLVVPQRINASLCAQVL